jgi:hypothetical protein
MVPGTVSPTHLTEMRLLSLPIMILVLALDLRNPIVIKEAYQDMVDLTGNEALANIEEPAEPYN